MRRRLLNLTIGLIGLGVPLLVAFYARRSPVDQGSIPASNLPPTIAPAPAPPERQLDLHPTGMFAALGRFDYRFRRWIPLAGLALVIGLNIWAATAGGKLIQGGWVIPGSEEQQAADLLTDRFGPSETTMLVIFTDPDGDAASPEFQATVRGSLAEVADDESVDRILTYADSPLPNLLSEDRTSTLAVVYLNQAV